jgi:carbon-monoxide dehydrogenase large subunit
VDSGAEPLTPFAGRPLLRREDRRLLVGGGRFVDDLTAPRLLHAAIVRSPHAHARILAVDADAALALGGVHAVFTGEDMTDLAAPGPMAWRPRGTEVLTPDFWPLARGRVACVGAPVAVVLADDPYRAADGAEAVAVAYERLAAVVDPRRALEPDAPLVHPELGTNRCHEWSIEGGDLDAGFAHADVVIEREIRNHRIAGVPMETRGVMAEPAGDRVTVWTSTQNAHLVRTYLARQLGVAEEQLRVVAPDVGGGFGVKANVYPEETLIAWCARRLRRAVKWVEDRAENLTSTNHGRDQHGLARMGLRRDGTITALHVRAIVDIGAYHLLFTPFIPLSGAFVAAGCYAIGAVRSEIVAVFTNKFPTDAVRGAGRPEATHLIEVMIEQAAAELRLDPLELRRRNFIPRDDFPARVAVGVTYDSGDYHASLDRLLEHVDVPEFRREQRRLRRRKRPVYRGIGFSTYMEACGLAPSRIAGPAGAGLEMGFWESAIVRVGPQGSVTVQTGSSPHGQGHETSFAQVVADRVGTDPARVNLIWGDTDAVPYGMGTYGSRSLVVGAEAAVRACDRVAAKARAVAAALLEASVDDVELADGRYGVRGSPQQSLSLAEIACEAYAPDRLPDAAGLELGLEATCFYDPSSFVHPFGAHAAIVEVDVDTGRVQILRWVAVDDCGRIVNPLIVEGQIHGGVAQAIGQALFEHVAFDESGQPLTASLADYMLPGAADLPRFETDHTETPSPVNSLGVKGVGEAGTVAATPAVLNAVVDALRPLGVTFLNMPLSPDAIWRAVATARQPG